MENVRVSLIAAMDEKRGIGRDNKLLFRIPDDMKRMRVLTNGHALVMGRKTFESLGRLLPNRTHIVVTRNKENATNLTYVPEYIVSSVMEGIEVGKRVERQNLQKSMKEFEGEVFVFGGGQIYKEAIDKELVDRLYLTVVKGDYKADTFFPNYSEYKKVLSEQKGKQDNFEFVFLDLEK